MTDTTPALPDASDDARSPGWEAIDAALAPLYPGVEPKHFGTLLGWQLGGPDPLDGVSAYPRLEPVPHWHFVTYGLTELYRKESEDKDTSGYGFELTMRVARAPGDDEPPRWAISFLQNLARYVFQSGNVFDDGHWMTANGPIALETDTALCSMGFVFDPELPAIDTPHGRMSFLQVVGLTLDEERAAKRWRTRALLDAFAPHLPLWVTDLARGSLLALPEVSEQVAAGSKRDGSSSGYLFTDVLGWSTRKRLLRAPLTAITVGARQVDELVALLPLRLPFDRPFMLMGPEQRLYLSRGESNDVSEEAGALRLRLTDATVQRLVETLKPLAGEYAVDGLDGVRWKVERTVIRDAQGNPVETFG